VSERIGYGLGEIRGLGDSELPQKVIEEPAEAIFTHNDTWGYIERDNNWKSSKEIIHHLVKCNAKGANFMLNVGPKGDGTFPEIAVAVMKNAGKWIKKNQESIYGTTHSPFPELSWGECTHRSEKLYLHVLKWPDDMKIRVPFIADNVESIRLLVGGKKLKYTKDGKDVLVQLPERCPDPVNTVIVVNYMGDLNIESVQTLMENCEVEFDVVFADLSGNAKQLGFHYSEEFGSWYKANLINKWSSEKDFVSWQFRAPRAGLYAVELDYSYPTSSPKREGLIMIDDDEKLYFECKGTGDQRHHFQKQPVGVIRISEPGYHKLSIRPTGEGEEFVKLRSLKMEPFE
jgi:alpha-L-fucosidase